MKNTNSTLLNQNFYFSYFR